MGGLCCCGSISSSTMGVIERFGKYDRVVEPGLYFKLPLIDILKHVVTTRRSQFIIEVDTKTSDNVFCKVVVAVIYSIKQNELYNAIYGYSNFSNLVNSYVQNEIRSELTRITLDESFLQKLTMSNNVKKSLRENISFGYNIHEVLINDIEPDPKVREAMNEINTQQRVRLAKEEKALGYKIETVSKAESDALASEIYGEGVAKSKAAIISGLKNSFPELSDIEISQLIIASEQINAINNKSTIFVPYDNKINFNMGLCNK